MSCNIRTVNVLYSGIWYSVIRVPVRPVVNNRGPPLDDDLETEAAVLANFDFLQNDVEDEEDNDDELDDGGSADDESEDRDDIRLGRRMGKRAKGRLNYKSVVVLSPLCLWCPGEKG